MRQIKIIGKSGVFKFKDIKFFYHKKTTLISVVFFYRNVLIDNSFNRFSKLKLSRTTVLIFCFVTIFAEKRSVSIWLEWKLCNFCSALRTTPVALIHLSVSKIIILAVHQFFTQKSVD